jgi:hypothetical protein
MAPSRFAILRYGVYDVIFPRRSSVKKNGSRHSLYRSRKSLGIDVDSLGAIRDPETGQYHVPSSLGRDVIPRELVAAIRWRVGNMSGVADLREEMGQSSAGKHLLLIEKVLYSGIHGGDTIQSEMFENLEAEIHSLQARRDPSFSDYLSNFLEKMLEIIQIARREGNPIVFV